MTDSKQTLDNMTVRRFAKLLKNNNKASSAPTLISGTVTKNDGETLISTENGDVSASLASANLNVGDSVMALCSNDKAVVIGNVTDKSASATELEQTTNDLTQKAEDAEKVATNYIKFDEENGLVVGNMQADTLQGNTQITSEGMNIRNGSTELASFKADTIELAKENQDASIKMCKGGFTISTNYNESTSGLVTQRSTTVNFLDWVNGSLVKFKSQTEENNEKLDPFDPETGTTTSTGGTSSWTSIFYTGDFNLDKLTNRGSIEAPYFYKSYICYTSDTTSATLKGSILSETELFSSSTGETGSITLEYPCTNYTYIDVHYVDKYGAKGSQRIYNPQVGDSISLSSLFVLTAVSTVNLLFKTLVISSATELQVKTSSSSEASSGYVALGGKTYMGNTEYIKVLRVVGIK